MPSFYRIVPQLLLTGWLLVGSVNCAEPDNELAATLRGVSPDVLPATERAAASRMIPKDIDRRLTAANHASTADWKQLDSREAWQRFRVEKLDALRKSLHLPATRPDARAFQITGTVAGDGFTVENIVFESRPGLLVTANLYRPAKPLPKMPGILICHSHHHPKTESELQTMGMTWARAGCIVLVMDQLGHGERRQHPFRTASDYPASFRVSRQDYFYRYHVALQLALAGESLIGWMVWDLHCGVELLLSLPGIDAQRIILLGAVAGGGDPAAVAGALDPRIAAVVPFNFGGPQPETRYPLPDDAEQSFDYAGGGSWESTRNLAESAHGGFLPWVIVGSIAPRRLVYGHEFNWDRERDPVWKRLNQIYAWEQAPDHLAFTLGAGSVKQSSSEATHCNNIGAPQRKLIHAAWRRWFNLEIADDEVYDHPLRPDQLQALTADVREQRPPRLAREVALRSAQDRAGLTSNELQSLGRTERTRKLRAAWRRSLGNIEPLDAPCVLTIQSTTKLKAGVEQVSAVVQGETGIVIPLLLFLPVKNRPAPVVIGIAQQGKARFLKENARTISALLEQGIAVCLPDVRGTGETALEDRDRDRTSEATSYSSSELMLGGTMLGARLRDLRNTMKCLRSHPNLDGTRLAIWGDSFTSATPSNIELSVPEGIDNPAGSIEPLGGMLSLLTALYEDDIQAVAVHSGLTSYASVLTGPRTYLPHDMLIPDAIGQGDIATLLTGIAPTPLRMWELRNGQNQSVPDDSLEKLYATAVGAYASENKPQALQLGPISNTDLAAWFAEHLQKSIPSSK